MRGVWVEVMERGGVCVHSDGVEGLLGWFR